MICWVITGAGHFLSDVCDVIVRSAPLDVYATRAGFEVASHYGAIDRLASFGVEVARESDSASRPIMKLWSGRWSALVIAPATSNTIAKCAHGIADSLASTFFSQAGKAGIPVFVLPTDSGERVSSATASGAQIMIEPREVDASNVRTIASFVGVRVATAPQELEDMLRSSGLMEV